MAGVANYINNNKEDTHIAGRREISVIPVDGHVYKMTHGPTTLRPGPPRVPQCACPGHTTEWYKRCSVVQPGIKNSIARHQ